MAKYKVAEIFVGRGKVFPLFGKEVEMELEDLFDRSDLLERWNYDEFGKEMRGLCLKKDLGYLQMKLEIIKQVIVEGKIFVKGQQISWACFEPKGFDFATLAAIRGEVEKRLKARL